MKIITQEIGAGKATIYVPEDEMEFSEFFEWLYDQKGNTLAVDTETTGLDIFSEEFKVRTIQVGYGPEAWVMPVEELGIKRQDVVWMLEDNPLVFHNAAYDLLAIRRFFGIELDWDRVTDTKILAHLNDPRPRREGGVGHSLQDLTAAYISPEIAEDVKGSMGRMCKEAGLKKAELFAGIDVWNETYLRYAGMDVILTHLIHKRLTKELDALAEREPGFRKDIIRYEHQVAEACATMEWNGFKVDVEYTKNLAESLKQEAEHWESKALEEYGVESVNSSAQVAEAVLEAGYRLNELTDTGAYKMDKAVLADLTAQGCSLAEYVEKAKGARKKAKSWVSKFMDVDEQEKIHASINPLAARTARMSITGIPAQTLPSNDWQIRRCFIPEDGNIIASCDYQAQELRVLAALSGDKNMQNAFAHDADLHQMTADASGVARKVGKTVNFAYVYGSGAGNIAHTCDITVDKAREVIKGFENTYPGVAAYSEKLKQEAKTYGRVVTPRGRVLPVDKEKPYKALNYMIQSTSRDITASAILRLWHAGMLDSIRLPIHDEVLVELPEATAEEDAEKVADLMACDFAGVHIGSDHDVLGKSWGGGYVNKEDPADVAKYESTFA